jgi:hypothetical protein
LVKKIKHPCDMFQINDYCLVRRDRIGRKGGGVCPYVKSNIKVEQINLVSHNSHKFEMIWRRVTVSKDNSVIVCALYHPPASSYTPYKER